MALVAEHAWEITVFFAEGETRVRGWNAWTMLRIETLTVVIVIVVFTVSMHGFFGEAGA